MMFLTVALATTAMAQLTFSPLEVRDLKITPLLLDTRNGAKNVTITLDLGAQVYDDLQVELTDLPVANLSSVALVGFTRNLDGTYQLVLTFAANRPPRFYRLSGFGARISNVVYSIRHQQLTERGFPVIFAVYGVEQKT